VELLLKTFDLMFGCRHRNLSRVFTIDSRTYRVCCNCGAEFDYSLEDMCPGRRLPRRSVFRWLRMA
jgi:hypothetical protein